MSIRNEVSDNDRRTKLRQSYFAKWDGEQFLYGQAAAALRQQMETNESKSTSNDNPRQREEGINQLGTTECGPEGPE